MRRVAGIDGREHTLPPCAIRHRDILWYDIDVHRITSIREARPRTIYRDRETCSTHAQPIDCPRRHWRDRGWQRPHEGHFLPRGRHSLLASVIAGADWHRVGQRGFSPF